MYVRINARARVWVYIHCFGNGVERGIFGWYDVIRAREEVALLIFHLFRALESYCVVAVLYNEVFFYYRFNNYIKTFNLKKK